ncbi:MAG TPA: hypothetical protein DC024_10510 [Clostridiales bacterium]|nr:hypothetical protein [Clostridiales bacterium]
MIKSVKNILSIILKQRRGVLVKNGKIKAVHDIDLESYLDSLGWLNKIKKGKVKCIICGQIITLNNLQAIIPYKDKIQICCSNIQCYQVIFNRSSVV